LTAVNQARKITETGETVTVLAIWYQEESNENRRVTKKCDSSRFKKSHSKRFQQFSNNNEQLSNKIGSQKKNNFRKGETHNPLFGV